MSLPRLALLLLCFALALAAAPPPSDPGIVLRVEGEEFVLRALDARDDADGPALRVALGSPARPTPRGSFALERVVLNPAWTPGTDAREAGARPLPPSSEGPMGVAKIPFAADGAFALHGGARSYLLGEQISSGCIRASRSPRAASARPTPTCCA